MNERKPNSAGSDGGVNEGHAVRGGEGVNSKGDGAHLFPIPKLTIAAVTPMMPYNSTGFRPTWSKKKKGGGELEIGMTIREEGGYPVGNDDRTYQRALPRGI